jgi:hypothetical protein
MPSLLSSGLEYLVQFEINLQGLWDKIVAQPWEFLTALATIIGVVFIIHQLLALKRQMTLEATLNLLYEYRNELMDDRIKFWTEDVDKIQKMLKDNPKLLYKDLPTDIGKRVRRISAFHDELGLLIQKGLVNQDVLLSWLGDSAINYFLVLRPLILNEEVRVPYKAYQEYFEDMVVRIAKRPPSKRRKTKQITPKLLESLTEQRGAWLFKNETIS